MTDDPAELGSEAKRFRGLAKWCGEHLKPTLITLAEDRERRGGMAGPDDSASPQDGDGPAGPVLRQPDGS